MTTAAIDKPTTSASETAHSPADIDLSSMFYGTEKETVSDSPKETETPTTETGNGSSTTSEKTSADPAESAKPGDSPKGEEKKEEKKADEGGHRAAAARLGNKVKELEAERETIAEENRILKSKLDGTYVKPKEPTADEVRDIAEFNGRETASRSLAVEMFGEDLLKESVYGDDSAFAQVVKSEVKTNREKAPSWSFLEVKAHPQPAIKAMHILNRIAFEKEHGEDPRKWAEKIIEAAKPKIIEDLKKQMKTQPTGTEVPTVTEGRNADAGIVPKERSMEDLFYGKKK